MCLLESGAEMLFQVLELGDEGSNEDVDEEAMDGGDGNRPRGRGGDSRFWWED